MNTDMTWETVSISSEQTEQLAEKLGAKLRGGEVIELVSDLGGGKTTFTRGLVRGTGSADRVASPTFTVSRQYSAGALTIVHFDFYRLAEAGIAGEELAEFLGDPTYIVVIEWGDMVQHVLPRSHIRVDIVQNGQDTRKLRFSYPMKYEYSMDGLKSAQP